MAKLIRRRSMEYLELYDLDKFNRNLQQLPPQPPPLPPPPRYRRCPSVSETLQRYQFLCNMTRNRTDPIYAATPMFTTIPSSSPSSKEKTHRQLLGTYMRLENVKPLPVKTPVSSSESQQIETDENGKEEEEEDDDEQINDTEVNGGDDADDDDDNQSSSSSSSDEQQKDDDDDDILDNDDNKQGIVKQIFNRDKRH